MQVSDPNNVKIYNLSAGKSLPEWLSERKRRALLKKDVDIRRKIELIQDFDMPGMSTTVKVSKDGQYVLATGIYKPRVKCFDVNNLSLKFESCFDSETVTFEILSDDYSKLVFLQCDRYVEFHAAYGRYHRLRIPTFGRDMRYHFPTCDLFLVGNSPDIYRLNLERGQFSLPFSGKASAINKCEINPVHHLLACGTQEGCVEAWDPRSKNIVGTLDCAFSCIKENNFLEGFPSVTALKFNGALQMAVGTATGQILIYDIRSNKPLYIKDHIYGLPIRDVDFHYQQDLVLSLDSSVLKIWDKNNGKLFTSIEASTEFNSLCTVPKSGLMFLANKNTKIQTYYIPSLGPAPRWASFLDSLTEELEENSTENVYDDYKFVTKQELESLGLDHLIGSKLLRAYMHGYFMDVRFYRKAKSMSESFEFKQYRKKKIRETIEKYRANRVQVDKLPKINKDLAIKLMNDKIVKNNKKKEAVADSLLSDDRFKALFENPQFEIDKNTDEYRLLNPVLSQMDANKKKELKKKIGEEFESIDEELEGKNSSEDSSGSEESSDDQHTWTKELKKQHRLIQREHREQELKKRLEEQEEEKELLKQTGESSETGVNSRKRKRAVTGKDDRVSKRPRNKDSESPSDLQDKPEQDELDNTCQTKQYIPHHLIGLMYRLDLSVFCSLRKSMYEHKYPSLSLAFEDSEIDKFSNIVLRYEEKSIHIQIENVDKYYVDNSISYARLFTKEKRSFFFINDYFNSFVKHLLSKSDSLSNNIEYLIIYTNSCLDFTEEKELKKGRFKNFYPFKFDSIDMEKYDILKDFLFTNDNTQGHGFYQFSQDEITRKELLRRLEFSYAIQKVIKERKFSQEFENGIKEEFLDKLIFAVNQPNREKLNSIVKSEIAKESKFQYDYIALQKEVVSDLIAPKKLKNYIPKIIYEFNLLMLFLHDMFLHKNIFSVSFKEKSYDTSNDITISYKDRTAYIKAHNTDSNICYSQLFPSRKQKGKNTFSINKHFSLFAEELKNYMRYFIIYTNADLGLTEEKELKKVRSKGFYPLKFDSIDIKACDILKDFLFTKDDMQGCDFYQFSQDKTTREELLKRLECSSAIQKVVKERKLSQEEMKEAFLDKLVFAINQPSREELNSIIKSAVEKDNKTNKVPYNYKELHEIALRWLESHEFGPITKKIMEKLLRDIKNNRSSYQKIQKNIDEETKFARSVVGREGTSSFYEFLNFLIKGEGRRYLEVLKRNEISLANMSSVLHGAGNEAVRAFKDLYDLWFDMQGNKKQCLKVLEENGINLVNISSILHGTRASAANTFKDLYDLWFDKKGNKTQYLTKLAEDGVDLIRMSSILGGAGANAAGAFKDLYNLWFDQNGKKTQYLTKLEEDGVDLVRMSSILSGAGANAAGAFKDLYDLWFDEQGNRTQCLKTLEKEGINLANMSSILHRAGNSTAQAFEDLYDLWFDKKGNKTQYLTKPAENGVDLVRMSSILSGAGANAAGAFKYLYNLWFDQNGKKTQYLTKLEENGVDLVRMSSILSGAGANAAGAFKDLYDLWFNEQGNRTQCLKTLEKEGINLVNISSILHRAGNSTAQAFKDLYNLWFDKKGNKTQYLKILEKEGVNLSTVCSILHGAGNGAAQALKDLHDIWFDEQGNKTQYLRNFTEKKDGKKGFTMRNLSSMLGGTGVKIKDTFEKLHNVCFNDEGKRTELLNDFYKAGFRARNLSCMLCGAGARISSILKKLHRLCFNEKGKKTKLLKDFFDKAGFRPCDLCNILSGAADSLEQFHDFCFTKETKQYLNRFLGEKESFTLSNLCNIFHGAEANACSALKDFHDVCFDNAGNKTQLLNDFHGAGFRSECLSNILSMAGNNAASILRNFHKSCFSKKNYLSHFLTEEKIFTPEILSKILYGTGTKSCSTFKQLHNLCFDKAGNKTDYLNDLIKNNPLNKIINILYKKVRKAPSTFLDDISLQQQSIIEESEVD